MEPVHCHKCHRTVSPDAGRCLWCGESLGEKATDGESAIFIEMEYQSGIARLTDPTPVRVMVNSNGVQIVEVMPGTRSIRISADQIVEAKVSASLLSVGKKPSRRWRMSFPGIEVRKQAIKRQCVLTIKYRIGGETFSAVFHREEDAASSRLSEIARKISALTTAG